MTKRKTRKEKKRLVVISLVMLALLCLLGVTVYKNFNQIMINKKEAAELSVKYDGLLEKQDQLESEVAKMQDPDYIARYAKEKYLYSSDDEIIIRMD